MNVDEINYQYFYFLNFLFDNLNYTAINHDGIDVRADWLWGLFFIASLWILFAGIFIRVIRAIFVIIGFWNSNEIYHVRAGRVGFGLIIAIFSVSLVDN